MKRRKGWFRYRPPTPNVYFDQRVLAVLRANLRLFYLCGEQVPIYRNWGNPE